jgi:SpoVK/Ycf46/Vps4 family AAA+-type ATPase
MFMGLSQFNSNNVNQGEFSYIRYLIPLLLVFNPFLAKLFNMLYEWIEDLFYTDSNENITSIKFPVHEVRVHKDGYGKDASVRQLYSINYLAVNDYIRENLSNIDGISNLIEILNVNMDYYSDDTNEKNFVLIPSDSSEILIETNNKIYCKIKSTEKSSNSSDDKDKKEKDSNDKVKTYELVLFCKLANNTNEEKKNKLVILNKFIDECVKKYNEKNEEKYEGKHLIYEYTHSYKDEYSGLELKFKEYLFENNKDLDTNIFFEGKEKLIKYVDKFIYNEEEVEKKITNKYEQEYKDIGYTYKATFLFYGFPGCGKTSTIKAILNRTKRHGIIINWSKIKTCEELETIFRNRTINHKEYDSRELCYIIEDCDASKNNILLSREKDDDENSESNDEFELINEQNEFNNEIDEDNNEIYEDTEENKNINENNENKSKKNKKQNKLDSIEKILKTMGKTKINIDNLKYNDDAINLSCLLNILDGLIELHGIMVIFTTNHPEKLDEAFLRPGRIELKQEFKRTIVETIKSIVCRKFVDSDNFSNEKFYEKFHNYVLSPAEVQSICFKTETFEECIKELIEETEKNMSRIKPSKSNKKINYPSNNKTANLEQINLEKINLEQE